ncbi:MAG: hypothetical protein RL734_1854 [Bacteroidota bacterium]|jgi:hypothetical protein
MIMFCTFSICISGNTHTKRWFMKKLFFLILFIGALVLANNFSALAQFTVIPNDSSWSWTLLQINPTISGSKDGNIIPLSTNDIIVAQQNTVKITSDGGKQWETKTLPESFSIPNYLDNNRIGVFAVRPAPSTIFLIADRRLGEVKIIKEGLGINPGDPTTWKYMATIEQAVLTTFDKGSSWNIIYRTQKEEDLLYYSNKMTLSTGNSKNCAVIINRDSALISSDGGVNWQMRLLPDSRPNKDVLQAFYTSTGSLWINYTTGKATFGDSSGVGGLCFISDDNGISYLSQELPRGGIMHCNDADILYLGHESTIRNNNKSEVFISRSSNLGKSWETIFNQQWIEGRGMNRASSFGNLIVSATRGSFSPVIGQLLPISEDGGNSWYYPIFPDSLFGILDKDGGIVQGGIVNPLEGFSDIFVTPDGIVGMSGIGKFLLIGRKRDRLTSAIDTYNNSSINNAKSVDDVIIYPNPAQRKLFIDKSGLSLHDCITTMHILNSRGSMVANGLSPYSDWIDISTLPNGYYYIQVHLINGQILSKPFTVLQ